MTHTRAALAAAVLALAAAHPARAQEATAKIGFAAAVKQAMTNNPTAAHSRAELTRAQALVREVRAAAMPTLNLNVTYTHLDANRTLSSGQVIQNADSLNGTLVLDVPILAPRQWAAWSHQVDEVDVQRFTTADAARQAALAAARAYLAVITSQRLVQVSQVARDDAKDHYGYAKTRLAGGIGNTLDEARARQQLASDEVTLQNANISLVRAEETLGVVVGVDRPLTADGEPRLDAPADLAAALTASDHRPDLRAGEAHAEAARHVERDSWTDYMPMLSVALQGAYQNPPTFVLPQTSWEAQVFLTVPLYDGGLRYGQKDEREALYQEARVDLAGHQRQVRADVRTAFKAARLADMALKAARDAADAAKHALDLADRAYRAGATDNLALIDAQRVARDTALLATLAEDTARQAKLDLLAASGRFP